MAANTMGSLMRTTSVMEQAFISITMEIFTSEYGETTYQWTATICSEMGKASKELSRTGSRDTEDIAMPTATYMKGSGVMILNMEWVK